MSDTDVFDRGEWDLWGTWMRAQRLLVQEIDRRLQSEFAVSKAEFSVLVTLLRATEREMRVADMTAALDWEKSRVSHQLTRMERRGLVTRTESGASGRRTGVALTSVGRGLAERAVEGHAGNVRRFFLDPLSAEQAAAIRAWSEQTIDRLSAGETTRARD